MPVTLQRTTRRSRLCGLFLVAVVLAQGGSADAGGKAALRAADRAPERPLSLPARLPARLLAVPILMYHRVHASPTAAERPLTVSPAAFARQMAWLDRRGYRTITQRQLFDALFRGAALPRKPLVITFDDGYTDVLRHASPVLVRRGMRGIAYVISGRLRNGYPIFLSGWQLRVLERRGIEIGSHTVTHRNLTSLSTREAAWELRASRRRLGRVLRHPVRWLAYPFGGHDRRVRLLARRVGYVLAVTTEHGMQQSADAPLALRRLRILNSTGVGGLAANARRARVAGRAHPQLDR
jgi:peptidoglycan/xylan/chitin deacetylase (PgdA/CDA1 family)